MERLDIITAYNKWCGKMSPEVGGKREGIMISCPNPSHPDKKPSAWINLDEGHGGVYYCGGCAEGGDKYDIAAYHFGYPIPGYKDGQTFHKLRQQMAESLGYQFQKVPGGQIIIPPFESPSEDDSPGSPQNEGVDNADKIGTTQAGSSPVANLSASESQSGESDDKSQDEPSGQSESNDPSLASVTPLDDDLETELIDYPTINWRKIVPKDTFLWEYMAACSNDDSPEEYHFWHAMLALGHACGRKVVLDDTKPVTANLLICLLGSTGSGKSRSRGWLHQVVNAVMPFKDTGFDTHGVKISAVPGSGEFLIRTFSYETKDPTTGKANGQYAPINGIVDFDELSSLLSRANRQGSTLKQVIMELADANEVVQIGSLTHGTFRAEQPFCSIMASTQPRAIRSLLNRNDTGSGFLNRWIFAGGRTKKREVFGGGHSSIAVDLSPAIEELKRVHAWGGFSRKLLLEPDALDRARVFWESVVLHTIEKDDTDLLKRLDLLLKKLMLLFTINLKSETVPLRAVDMAIEMWEYLITCYGILNENIGITQNQEVQNEILRITRSHWNKHKRGVTIRDIQRAKKGFSNDQIKRAIETMLALQLIELEPRRVSGHVGRPTTRYIAVGE